MTALFNVKIRLDSYRKAVVMRIFKKQNNYEFVAQNSIKNVVVFLCFFDCETDYFLPSPLFDDMIIAYSHSFVIGKTVPILCKFIAMIQMNYEEHQVSMGNAIRNQVSLTESKIDRCKSAKCSVI